MRDAFPRLFKQHKKESDMTPNNHPPFDSIDAEKYFRDVWCLMHVRSMRNVQLEDWLAGARFQYDKDLRTMIPREKVEKLLKALEFYAGEGHVEYPNAKNGLVEKHCVDYGEVAYEALEEFTRDPDGKDE